MLCATTTPIYVARFPHQGCPGPAFENLPDRTTEVNIHDIGPPIGHDAGRLGQDLVSKGAAVALDQGLQRADQVEHHALLPRAVEMQPVLDGDIDQVVVPGQGTWTVDPATGDVTFTPADGFTNDPTPIDYSVSDTTGLVSNTATIEVFYPQTQPTAVDDYQSNPVSGAVLSMIRSKTE